jgi:hypothetical protein
MVAILLVEAQLKGYGRVKDGSMNLSFRTNREISHEEAKQIDEYYQQNGYLAFRKDQQLRLEDIPDNDSSVPGAKSPSKVLRDALWKKHVTLGGKKEDFPDYYQKVMAQLLLAVEESY